MPSVFETKCTQTGIKEVENKSIQTNIQWSHKEFEKTKVCNH